ncbi:MAG TPA: ChbG/HpnK family deacetylase [Thermoanaerobaculia bacterium]|nr:ChbG/HpnK family deacetylase [Thermoanaerobaculia bacterium]
MRRLVVTADDVGLHPALNRGALHAHEHGIVTAVSVVANGRAFADAVERLRTRPELDVGAHLTLVGERPLSPPREVPSLLGRDGALLPGWPAFVRRYLRGGIRREEVERELRRQVERLLASGLPVVHLNSHQHLHVLPGLFAVVLLLAREHGVPFVRVPAASAAGAGGGPRRAQAAALGWIARRSARQLAGARGVAALGQTLGIAAAGRLTAGRLRRLIPAVGAAAELVCHPGLDDPGLAATYRWGYSWGGETAALCDPGARETLRAAGVELATFRELAAA